jgi:hypothetical protein
VAVGAVATSSEGEWLNSLLARSGTKATDLWQQGLVRAARLAMGEPGLKIEPADLAIALAAKGIGVAESDQIATAWTLTSQLKEHEEGVARDAVRLAVFDHVLARQGQIAIGAAGIRDLISLLRNAGRSLKLWQYEDAPRTARSLPARWEIDNEYHFQALLWVILAPVFSDLEDEENLPSVGHKHPRADLGIPSLRTIIEVKYMRGAGQAALAKVTEEIAADASLYLSKPIAYDKIIVVVWDDRAQTEQHHELQTGLESINGITAAIVIPRPSFMQRNQKSAPKADNA